MKSIKHLATIAAFGSALAGCSSNPVTLTPAPPRTTVSYTQIERLSRPAIKEVFETYQQHQISNAVEPYGDDTIKTAILGTEDAVRPPTASTDYGKALQGILYPDEYTVNLAGTAPTAASGNQYFLSYELTNGAAFGGRAPNDDVIDLELSALFGKALVPIVGEDNEENNCLSSQNIAGGEDPSKKTTNTFPYLPTPS